ncbi:hypothetical protein ABZ353_02840 [Streptomyces niveus]|uniref:Uncharacterized protein n=1 Tax=Streptomyces niveus TaxID=193462 RepID=A0A1U9QM30_STRNV|nr:hypothetical protein [Streptomyces niveus]AQU65312.1 hypothetical protein BBN63_02650 [Streptomyces niveus]
MPQSDKGRDEYDQEEFDGETTEETEDAEDTEDSDDAEDTEDAEVVAAEEEPDDYAEGEVVEQGPPDVYLDVPVLNIEEIQLNVQDLRAHVSLQAEVLDLVKLNVGADVTLGSVDLDIKGVEAQAQLKVRLHNVATIVNRVLTTIDRNPEILEQLSRGLGEAVEEVGTGAGGAVKEIGKGTGDAAESVGRGAGAAAENVGEGAGKAVEDVGEGADEAVKDVGGSAGDSIEAVGKSTGEAVTSDSAGKAHKAHKRTRRHVKDSGSRRRGDGSGEQRDGRNARTARRRDAYKR